MVAQAASILRKMCLLRIFDAIGTVVGNISPCVSFFRRVENRRVPPSAAFRRLLDEMVFFGEPILIGAIGSAGARDGNGNADVHVCVLHTHTGLMEILPREHSAHDLALVRGLRGTLSSVA